MKFQRIVVITLSILLVACGGPSQSSDTSLTTTTSIEQVNCSQMAIEVAVGQSTSLLKCVGEWAAVQPVSYVRDCTECESVWLYKWDDAKWNLMGRCNQYVLLVESESPCSPMTGWMNDDIYIDAMADFPSRDVACDIWPINRYTENVSMTGCAPDQ